eukprot:scaffold5126_cov125-Isochrysis_galbana.AAC.6
MRLAARRLDAHNNSAAQPHRAVEVPLLHYAARLEKGAPGGAWSRVSNDCRREASLAQMTPHKVGLAGTFAELGHTGNSTSEIRRVRDDEQRFDHVDG